MVTDTDFQFLSQNAVSPLNKRKRILYANQRDRFITYLENNGKNPKKQEGYSDPRPIARLVHQVYEWIWQEEITIELTVTHADKFIHALNQDEVTRSDGDPYAEGTKRKFVDALNTWFEFQDTEWSSPINFTDEPSTDGADLFSKDELRWLWDAALEYDDIPSYNDLSPDDRDRWKAYIAQKLGRPKEDVTPADWEEINQSWHVPSLIRTTRDAAWRPALIGRMQTTWYDSEKQVIRIPAEAAVKNNQPWEQKLSDEGAFALERWLEQRENKSKYDGRDEVWLNRKGNPHNSQTLNRILNDLIEEAGIDVGDRNLTWYSFRHSKGTYVYEKTMDLKAVAIALRQASTSSASRYVHPTPETRSELANIA